jgi:hypothetical protein
VVERIADMPAGTLGFRISGKISRDEYFQMLDPVRELLERGEKVSFLVQTEPDFRRARPSPRSGRTPRQPAR